MGLKILIVLSTLAGLEPTRDRPNRFLVGRLNHSATVSFHVAHDKLQQLCTTTTQQLYLHTYFRSTTTFTLLQIGYYYIKQYRYIIF